MERIQRALDIARSLRAASPGAAAAAAAPHVLEEAPQRPIHRHCAIDVDKLRERRVILPADATAAGHAYRMLRTQLLRRVRDAGAKVIGVVSAVDGEGKTLTAVNLALNLAADPSQTVLLVDLDLRRPMIASLLGLAVENGLESVLGTEAGAVDVVCRIDAFERVYVLPTLAPLPDAYAALANPRTHEMLRNLHNLEGGPLLLLDLPPILLSEDVLTIAPALDGVIVVASEGRTRRTDLARVAELIGRLPILATVLNRASESEQRAY
jgi:Mrp family chromosome partitioning ATPase